MLGLYTEGKIQQKKIVEFYFLPNLPNEAILKLMVEALPGSWTKTSLGRGAE